MPSLCRDCLAMYPTGVAGPACPACRSRRLVTHPELATLSIAHMDCDAFYASVEKRDNPALADKPVIVGGGHRGVVSTCCYIARVSGVRSAMPMFQALKLCPDAVVIRPRGEVYARVSRQIRALMDELTPQIEPLSLDEAFLDLSGTARLHGAPPALMLARLVRRMETELGISGSVGLSHNKFLAKIASDIDKPRGFAVIGANETADFLRDRPVRLIWGVGAATQDRLEAAGIRTFSDLCRWDRRDLALRFGAMGDRLWHLARGQDRRRVSPRHALKTVSHETTFHHDIGNRELLEGHLWRLAEQVSDRAKAKGLAGRTVAIKLKRADFRLLTRRETLPQPTQLAHRLYASAARLLALVPDPGPYRLAGVGLSDLCPAESADLEPDLLDADGERQARAERATDAIRARFGPDAIIRGRALR